MRTVILLVIIVAIGLITILIKRKQDPSNPKPEFFSLDDGNQDELILFSTVSQEWIDSTKAKYKWENYELYDNRLWEYMYKLFDDVVAQSGIQDFGELWNKMNRPQKVFWAFLAFSGDTDNGGVYQFIFNKPEFILAVAEMWEEIGLERVSKDYNEVLKELTGKAGKISELKAIFNDDSKSWDNRWSSFSEGYKELKSTQKIEEYFYDKEFKKECHQKVADYIEKNMDKFRK